MAKKRSWVGWARLGVYMLAAGGQAVRVVADKGFTKEAAQYIAYNYTGRDGNGNWSPRVAAITYSPLAAVAAVDTVASKLGVYKRMGSL